MKLTVIFQEKKFIVVISHNSIVNDLKEEILRVYTALFPDSCPIPTSSKIQTLTGCVLFDGYTVSSVLSDNDIIRVLTDSIPDEPTNQMPILSSDSPLICPHCGVVPMGYHSPAYANNKGYVATCLHKHSTPAHYGHLSSVLGTPAAMSLVHSPMSTRARNASIQCPSPEMSSEEDISHTNRKESNNTNLRPVELGKTDHSPISSSLSHLHCQGLSTPTHEKKSLPRLQRGSLIQTVSNQVHGNTPTVSVLATTRPNDESSVSLSSSDVAQPEGQKSASSKMKKKKKHRLMTDQASAKSISKKRDTKKGAEVVQTSSSDSQTASAVNLKSPDTTNPASSLVKEPVVDTVRRTSQHVASASATLRMKECVDSPPSKMDIRKRKLSEKNESDPKKAKVVRMKKEKQKSTAKNVELNDDDTSEWSSTDDDESEAGKSHSSSKTTTTLPKPSEVTNKSKSHISDESTSEWESDNEVEGTPTVKVATSNVRTKKLVDKSETTSTPGSDCDEMISPHKTKVDVPKSAPSKSRGRSKAAKKAKSNMPHTSVKSTSGNTIPGPQRGASSQESLSGSPTTKKSGTKKEKRKEADDVTALSSSDWSSNEEPSESVVSSKQPKPKQREKGGKHSTKRKPGDTHKQEPVAQPKSSRETVTITDKLPTEPQDKNTSGQSSKRTQRVVSKDTESKSSPRYTKSPGTPISTSVEYNAGRNGTADETGEKNDSDPATEGKSRSVGGDETKDSANTKHSGKEDTDSENSISQADKTLESWSTVSSPPKGVYTSWDRQRLKLKKHHKSSSLHSTEVAITESINKDEMPSGNGVKSDKPDERPSSLMMMEPSDSNEILAPNSLSDEDITAAVALSQSDDAITTIEETQEIQDGSRSPSPEIPFLNHERPQSSTPHQKLQDNVTLKNKSPSYSDKDKLRNKAGLPHEGSPHQSSGDSKAQRKQAVDDCNETGLCDASLVPSSQTDISDEDVDCDGGSTTTAGCSADTGRRKSSLRMSGIKSKSEKSDQTQVETEMDENNVTSESSQGKQKRKQKQKKHKRKNKTLTIVDQVHKEENTTVSPERLGLETESQEMDTNDAHMTSTDNDATEHTSEMSDVSDLASQPLGRKRKKHKKKKREGLKSTFSDQQLEVISEEASTAAPVTGSDKPSGQSPSQTTDYMGSNTSSKVHPLSSPNHLTKKDSHDPQNHVTSPTTLSGEKGFLKPLTPKKSPISTLSPASKMKKSGEESLSTSEQKKAQTNLLSIFSVTETEHSSEESSCEHVGATGGSQVHKRHGKRPHKHSFLSSLGSCRRKAKPARRAVPLSRNALLHSSSQRRFSSEVGMRMFSLTNSPTSSTTRRAKLHSTPRLSKLSPSKQTERMSPALDNALKKASVEGDGGKEPSLSELLADGSLWDS